MGLLSLMAELGLNISPFTAGLSQAKKETERFAATASNQFSSVGSDIRGKLTGALIGFVSAEAFKRLIDYGVEVKGLAAKLNTTTENAQAIRYAAGSAIEEVVEAFKHLRVAQANADTTEMEKAWKTFGFTIEEIRSKRADEIFFQISEKVKQGSLSNMEYAAMLKLMGKNADELIPKLKELAAKASFFRASALGLTEAELGRISTLKTLVSAGGVGEGLGMKIMAEMLSPLSGIAELMKGDFKKGLYDIEPPTQRLILDLWGMNPHKGSAAASSKKIEESLNAAEQRDRERIADEAQTKDLQEQAKLDERIAAIRFNMLTDDQKRLELNRRLNDLSSNLHPEDGGSLRSKTTELAMLETQQQLKQLTSSRHTSLSQIRPDSLAAVGSFIGNAGRASNPMMEVAQQQLVQLQEINNSLDVAQGNFF